MDVLLTLILSCSVHVDDNLVQALADKLSVGNQFFVGDLSDLKTYDKARRADEARKIVESIAAAGGRPAVGLMAIPIDWAPRFGRTVDDLFDGCTNIGIGTAMLSDFDRLCSPAASSRAHRSPPRHHHSRHPATARRACILRRLEAALNIEGIAEHVLPVASQLDAAPRDPTRDGAPAHALVHPDNTDVSQDNHDWSSPRLFLSPTVPPAGAAAAAPRGRRIDAVPASRSNVAPSGRSAALDR